MKKIALIGLLAVIPAPGQDPKFEAADVHVSPTARSFAQNFGGVLREGRYVNRDATMLNLVTSAWEITEDRVGGGPGWMSSDLFDVIAKVPDGTTMPMARLMLRSLLAERFKLVTHTGNAPVPRYVLTVAKGGSKLKPGSGNTGCQPQQQQQGGGGGRGGPTDLASVPNAKMSCHNLTAAAIAENLRQMAGAYFDKDIVDQTKLEGTYDFDIEWTARGALAAKGADGISMFDAIEKQLGLKAELQNVPLPGLVVESVSRRPLPNPAGLADSLKLAEARFEVATIKPADPNDPRPIQGLFYPGNSEMRSGGTLHFLIALAMQVSPNVADDMVFGLPKFADTQKWAITAKVPSTGEGAPNIVNGRPLPPPLSVGLEMLRGLLVDQFGLKTHTENREVTVYALTLGNGKPKMTRADDSERSTCVPDLNAPKPATNIQAMMRCTNTSMADLAENLVRQANAYIDHPVVDATGLQDGWDFLIGWTPRAALQPAPNPNQSAASDPADPGGISVFEAVEKELGLKLVKQKRTIPVIVVDHVNEKPEN